MSRVEFMENCPCFLFVGFHLTSLAKEYLQNKISSEIKNISFGYLIELVGSFLPLQVYCLFVLGVMLNLKVKPLFANVPRVPDCLPDGRMVLGPLHRPQQELQLQVPREHRDGRHQTKGNKNCGFVVYSDYNL